MAKKRNFFLFMLIIAMSGIQAAPVSMGFGIGLEAFETDFAASGFPGAVSFSTEVAIFPQEDEWNLAARADVVLFSMDGNGFQDGWSPSGDINAMIRWSAPCGISMALGGGVHFPGGSGTDIIPELVAEPSYLLGSAGYDSPIGMRIAIPLRILVSEDVVLRGGVAFLIYLL